MGKLFLGKTTFRFGAEKVEGQQVVLDGEDFYRIANTDRRRPFFLAALFSGVALIWWTVLG